MASWLDEAKPVEEAAPGWLAEATPAETREVPLHETALAHGGNAFGLGAGPKARGLYAAGEGTGAESGNPIIRSPLVTAMDVLTGLYRKATGDPEAERRYQAAHDAEKAYLQETGDANPKTALASSIAGGAPTAGFLGAAAPVAKGAGLLPRAVTGLSQGTTVGLGYGLGSGEDAGDVAASTAVGGGAGALTPVVGAGVKKVVDPVFEYVANALDRAAVKYGRKAVTGVSSPLARRKLLPEEAVRAAFDADAIRPGGTVETVASRLRDPVDEMSARYGEILEQLEARGVHGSEAENLAAFLAKDASEAANNSIIGTQADALRGAADALRTKALPVSGKGRLGLMQEEQMKRELQNAAAGDFVKEGRLSLSGHARKEVAGKFREAIEQAVADQAHLAPDEAAAFQPVKERLHRLLEASGAANEAAARAGRRSPFGLHEAMGLATGIATGNPLQAVGAAGLMGALKERGASTLAWGANRGARALSTPVRSVVDPEVAAFIASLERPEPRFSLAAADEDDPK